MSWGVNPRFDFGAAVPEAADLGAVHFLAIGGISMSGIARLLAQRGLRVTGCDAKESATVAELRQRGIDVAIGHDPSHLDGVGTVVVSSAVRETNPELALAREHGLRVLHRSQALASLLQGRTVAAVAGAHGKSTTSAMLVTAVAGAGGDPSYQIGAEVLGATNAALGEGDVFVVEADESDGSFVTYHPHVAVVTNIAPDHLDFYGDLEHVVAAYERFADTIRPGGLLVACADNEGSAALARGRRAVTYGRTPGSDVRLGPTRREGALWGADVTWSGGSRFVGTRSPGEVNVLNAAGAFAAAVIGLGLPAEQVAAGLAAFAGTHRRFEVLGAPGGVTVVDDYSHNPDKVAAAIATARSVADGGRVLVVFQPHLFSRTRDLADGFVRSLAAADLVVALPIYPAREDPLPGVTTALLTGPLRDQGREVVEVAGFEEAVAAVVAHARPGDLVMTVGAGDVTEVAPVLLERLAGAEQG